MNCLSRRAVSICVGTACTSMVVLRKGILFFALSSGFAIADDSARNTALRAVYDHSGVHAHLSWVHSTVVDETKLAWQECENDQNRSAMESILKENLSIDVLKQG